MPHYLFLEVLLFLCFLFSCYVLLFQLFCFLGITSSSQRHLFTGLSHLLSQAQPYWYLKPFILGKLLEVNGTRLWCVLPDVLYTICETITPSDVLDAAIDGMTILESSSIASPSSGNIHWKQLFFQYPQVGPKKAKFESRKTIFRLSWRWSEVGILEHY